MKIYTITFIFIICQIWDICRACGKVQAYGAIAQKGAEGDYTLNGTCIELGYSLLYQQNRLSTGWGTVFYLYYYHNPEDYKFRGWVFSVHPCSDIIFIRSESDATTPDMVNSPWEEAVSDHYMPNEDFTVTCIDHPSTAVVVGMTFIIVLSILILITSVMLMYHRIRKSRYQDADSSSQNVDQHVDHHHLNVQPQLPPPYTEAYEPPSYIEHSICNRTHNRMRSINGISHRMPTTTASELNTYENSTFENSDPVNTLIPPDTEAYEPPSYIEHSICNTYNYPHIHRTHNRMRSITEMSHRMSTTTASELNTYENSTFENSDPMNVYQNTALPFTASNSLCDGHKELSAPPEGLPPSYEDTMARCCPESPDVTEEPRVY